MMKNQAPKGELAKPGIGEMATQAVGTAFAAFLGLAVGGPIGSIIGAGLTPYGIRWMEHAAAEWKRKSQIVAESAISASEIENPDDILQTLSEDPALTALTQRILFAAYMSGNESRLRALGALLGKAITRRGDWIDEAHLLTSVLSEIEKPQVVTLDILNREPPDSDTQRREHPDIEPSWLIGQVRSQLPMNPELALACLNNLVRHGLVETLSTYGGGSRYRITSFGRSLAEVMALAAG